MRPIIVDCGPFTAPSATNIRTASSIAAAGSVTLNGSLVAGGVATLDNARRVLFTSSGNDSGITFTLVGTDWNGNIATEVLTGGNAAAVYTLYDYKTISSIVASGASAGTVSIGTNAIASSRPVFLDAFADGSFAVISSTNGSTAITYTIRYSGDSPNAVQIGTGNTTYTTARWINSNANALVNATAAAYVTETGVPTMAQIFITNAGSNTSAYVHVTFTQSGVAPY